MAPTNTNAHATLLDIAHLHAMFIDPRVCIIIMVLMVVACASCVTSFFFFKFNIQLLCDLWILQCNMIFQIFVKNMVIFTGGNSFQ